MQLDTGYAGTDSLALKWRAAGVLTDSASLSAPLIPPAASGAAAGSPPAGKTGTGTGTGTGGAGPVTFVLSTDDVDRHGDVVSAGGWRLEAYLRNPVLLWAHDYRCPAIGRAVSVWSEPHRLLATMEFAPSAFAQEVAGLYLCGFQWGVSVGFRPIRWEERRDSRSGAFLGLRYLEQELLEVSAVPVPANRHALRRAAGDSGPFPDYSEGPGGSGDGIHWRAAALGALLAELKAAQT